MTIRELSQLHYLNLEIERDRAWLEALRTKSWGAAAQVITGMPHVPGITDKVGEYAAEIADLQSAIKANLKRCLREADRLNRYIAGIPDSMTRLIFAYRFVNGLPWGQVAANIGGGNTEWGVRQRAYRYLREN
jgi:hypothetical protein